MSEIKTEIRAFRDTWVNEYGRSNRTAQTYGQHLNRLADKMNLLNVEDLRPEVLNKRFFAFVWERMDSNHSLKPHTKRSIMCALKSFIKYLEEDDKLPAGAHQKIRLPQKEVVYLHGLNHEQVQTLAEHCLSNIKTDAQLRNAALIFFLLATGCRISEALSLDVHGDGVIKTNANMISGNFSYSLDGYNKPYCVVHIHGKGRRDRFVPVNDTAITILNMYLNQRKTNSNILFLSHHRKYYGAPVRFAYAGAYQMVCKYLKDASIDVDASVKTHVFRHTKVDHWIDQGVNDNIICDWMGFTPVTLEVYKKRNQKRLAPFVNKTIIDDLDFNADVKALLKAGKQLYSNYSFF